MDKGKIKFALCYYSFFVFLSIGYFAAPMLPEITADEIAAKDIQKPVIIKIIAIK